MPDPIKNVFKDMRDRKMLPLVALLILAIVAVPLLLKSGSDAAAPAGGVASGTAPDIAGAEIADPVVLTAAPGIRNYHERLASLQEKNPFKQQLTSEPGAGSGGKKAAASEDAAAGATDGSAAASTQASAGTTASDTTTSDTTTPEDPKANKTYLYYWEIDAKAGPVGAGDKMTGIRALDYVPGKSHPILQFIRGVGEEAAIFVVSRSATDSRGDGNCQPRPKDCQFLKLKLGESTTFKYEPNGLNYRIKLTGVHLLRKQIDPGDPSTTAPSDDFAQLGANG